MRVSGEIKNVSLSMEGVLEITFIINEKSKALKEIEEIKNQKLTIEAKKFRQKRSLSANAYMWQLFNMMAQVLGSDKDTVYLMELEKYGQFVDLSVRNEAAHDLVKLFRYVTPLNDGYQGFTEYRCYFGTSGYNTLEMSGMLDGVVRDCQELGISTMTDEEIDYLIKNWKGDKDVTEREDSIPS